MLASPHLSDRAIAADAEPVSLDTAEERWAFAWARRDVLLAYAMRRTRYPQVAADALAYALLEAGRAKARHPGALHRWLEKCIRHEIAREERGRGSAKSRARYANTLLLRETDTARLLDEDCESALMLRIVASLPPHLRQMFTMLGEGRTAREVASEFGMTVKAVECLIWRTRRWCRMELAKATAACPTPFLPRLLRGRRAGALLPVVGLLAVALTVLVVPLLPNVRTRSHTGDRPAVARPPVHGEARGSHAPQHGIAANDTRPTSTPAPTPPPAFTGVEKSDIKKRTKGVTDRLPPSLRPWVRQRNDGDGQRQMEAEVVLCVERFVATLPPRSLPCQSPRP